MDPTRKVEVNITHVNVGPGGQAVVASSQSEARNIAFNREEVVADEPKGDQAKPPKMVVTVRDKSQARRIHAENMDAEVTADGGSVAEDLSARRPSPLQKVPWGANHTVKVLLKVLGVVSAIALAAVSGYWVWRQIWG